MHIYIHKNESKHTEMGPVRQNPIQRPVRSVHMCVHCTVHNCSGPMNKSLKFDGDPDHRLNTGIVFRIRHYCEIRQVPQPVIHYGRPM